MPGKHGQADADDCDAQDLGPGIALAAGQMRRAFDQLSECAILLDAARIAAIPAAKP
jgi:hypothetical protein